MEDIRRAYLRLSLRFHPDKNKDPGARETFQQVAEAYETLHDISKRRAYDAASHAGRAYDGGTGRHGAAAQSHAEQLFQAMSAMMGGWAAMQHAAMQGEAAHASYMMGGMPSGAFAMGGAPGGGSSLGAPWSVGAPMMGFPNLGAQLGTFPGGFGFPGGFPGGGLPGGSFPSGLGGGFPGGSGASFMSMSSSSFSGSGSSSSYQTHTHIDRAGRTVVKTITTTRQGGRVETTETVTVDGVPQPRLEGGGGDQVLARQNGYL